MTTKRERGTLYVNGSCLGPCERDPKTGAMELGPQVTARAAKDGQIAVVRVDQSPLNAKQWQLTLSCGHWQWVTANKRPTRKTAKCERCCK